MKTDLIPQTTYLKNYTPFPYRVGHINLNFDIQDGHTIVTATTKYTQDAEGTPDLFLNGEDLDLLSLSLNGKKLEPNTEFSIENEGLTLPCPKTKEFTLEIITRIYPEKNTYLEGLYKSGDTYCTQCEAEGFRRITYYPDRPDVMATFTTRIEANSLQYPVLLGNGNLSEKGTCENNRHFAIWHDHIPKPCYLFALVAADLAHIKDQFTTRSGRNVDLYIYVRKGDEDQCDHAMQSLKKSMAWDEDVYGLEYDLDIFNIVAVSDFNMGAMENKSLNIFNTALVLAHQDTATDHDFMRVESVIAHEYFHNWSGNRVTCRDWFQLSLKEGLTVFRDQEFSADLNSRPVQRIDDVALLRNHQFPEDSGPLSHPIRPDNYIEINNFYTRTVYEKGAEVIRMIQTILGKENYRKGTDLYFSRHDGDAATCENFIQCMQDASGTDLSHFKLWYEQAGTPHVHFSSDYKNTTYTITVSQTLPDTPGQSNKKPMHIPIHVGLIGRDGKDIESKVLHLTQEKQTFVFDNVNEHPIPSILRNFSAPVKLTNDLTHDDLAFLMLNDSDGFNKWEACQQLSTRIINDMLDSNTELPDLYLDTYGQLLEQSLESDIDKALIARCLSLPDIGFVGQYREYDDPPAIYKIRDKILRTIKRTHRKTLDKIYDDNCGTQTFDITPIAMGQRALKNMALHILTITGGSGCRRRAKEQYDTTNNMTDRMSALHVLARIECDEANTALDDFYTRYHDHALVIDKWFAVQASAAHKNILDIIRQLERHPDFHIENPNRVRSLYATFSMRNFVGFHQESGEGYDILTEAIIRLNTINPQIAARLCSPLRSWRRYTPEMQDKMRSALQRIQETPNLSPNVFEIVSKSLRET